MLARAHSSRKPEIPKQDLQDFCARHGLRKVYLFGSILTNEFDDESDVDVMIEAEPSPGIHEIAVMTEELEAIFRRKVDLVTKDAVEAGPSKARRERILGSAKVYAPA